MGIFGSGSQNLQRRTNSGYTADTLGQEAVFLTALYSMNWTLEHWPVGMILSYEMHLLSYQRLVQL